MSTAAAWILSVSLGCGAAQTDVAAPPRPTTAAVNHAASPKPAMPAGWRFANEAPVAGKRGMVVTDAALASKVGLEVLATGGNAIDAAVATAFALAVVHPSAGNIGGGGFMVARVGRETRTLDFRETAPAAAARDMYLGADGKSTDAARKGHRSAAVPGSVAGLWEAHRVLGSKRKTWEELVRPAIKLAEEGFRVDEGLADSVVHADARLQGFPASAALFYPDGKPLGVGAIWKNPDLAAVLRRVAADGPAGFYAGPTAHLIVDEMKAGDGVMTLADLAAYKPAWRAPVEFDYRGHHVISMPPPSSGGVTLAMICHILDGYDLKPLGWHTAPELHLVFEAMRRAFAARNARLGDPDFVRNPLDELLSPAWADAQRKTILPDHATPSADIAPGGHEGGMGPHTTHFSVTDEQGNAVALTTTINWWFGSGVTVHGAGFLLNNEMDDFASVPGTANGFGLVQGEPNAVAPGKRMLSSMAPTIVLGPDGGVRLVLGAAGGPTIISAVFNTMSSVLDFGLDVSTAVSAPRFHQQHLPDVVLFEKDGLEGDTKLALETMGYKFVEKGHIADAPAIGRGVGEWLGASEPRRLGGLAAGR